MFKKIETDNAIIVKGGVYKQADVYEFQGGLYLKANGGFVRVNANGGTSVSGLSLHTIMREGSIYADPWGRLCVDDGPKRKTVLLEGQGDDEGRSVMQIENKSTTTD